jgi:hypothetical protein
MPFPSIAVVSLGLVVLRLWRKLLFSSRTFKMLKVKVKSVVVIFCAGRLWNGFQIKRL